MTIPSTTSVDGNLTEESQIKQEQQQAEGTSYQEALGPKAHRKHFFSPLDPAWAEAVHRDAETVQYTPEEEVSRYFGMVCNCSVPDPTTIRNGFAGRSITECFH